MHFSKSFRLCLSLYIYTTAASPVDFSPDISIREVPTNISTRHIPFHDFQAREAGLSAPQTGRDAAGSIPLGARSLFHRHTPVRCMGGSGHFCEKNCACTKGGSVSCEKLSKAEFKKFKKAATGDEKSLEEHAQRITDNCAGVCSCDGGKVPGTKVRKIGFQIGYGDLKAAAYHVTEKDTRVHPPVAPVAPVAPYGAPPGSPPSAPPGPPSFHSNGPAIDPYNSGVESYTPSIQRRGNAASDRKDLQDAGEPFYSKEQTPPSCKGSRPVCQGHCYCTSTRKFTCDRLTKSQRKTFGSGPAVSDAIREHALNVKTACEPWCECKGKGKDWVEGKTLTEFNYGVGRNRGSGDTNSISSADPTGLAGAGGGERAPENTSGSLSVDRGHLRGAGVPSSPTASRDDSAHDLSGTASHSFSLQRRGVRLSKDKVSSPQAVGYSALHSGPGHLASFHEEPIKCRSIWRKKCEAHCYCTTQGTMSCDRLPAKEVERLKSHPDSGKANLDRAAGVLKICKPVCGCKDRDGVYKIEGRTFEEWDVMIRQGYKNTPAPAAGDFSPGGARGGGTFPVGDVSLRHGISASGSQAPSSPPPATDNLPVSSPPSLDRPSLHPRGTAVSTDKETSPSLLEPSGRGSRSDTIVCSDKNGQNSFCEARCHCTATGTVMCGKRTDWGTTAAVAQPGTEDCLNDCWCSPGEEKARGGWGTWKLPGGGHGLTKGSDTPEFPSNRPDQVMRTPEPRQNMPLPPTPHHVPSSFSRQFPAFNQHSIQVLHPRSGSSEVLQARSGIGSKLKEKISPGQRLICHDAVKEFCLTRYTCDATGMILERGQKSSFNGMCGGFPCGHTPQTTETHYTIETCKSACTCMRTKGRGELRQIGNTGEFWGGFRTPAVRGPRRRIGPIHEQAEALPVASALSPSPSQTVGQSKALHPRGGVGEAIKKEFGPSDRRLVCEGAPKHFCQARYSCSKTGAMTKECTNPVHCVSLSTQDHSVRDCKASCLCFDFKNRKALREIGSTGEQWGGLRGGIPHQTPGRPEAGGPEVGGPEVGDIEVGGPEAMMSTSASKSPASQAALKRRGGVALRFKSGRVFIPHIVCSNPYRPQSLYCKHQFKCNGASILVRRRGISLPFLRPAAVKGYPEANLYSPADNLRDCTKICGCMGDDGQFRRQYALVVDWRQEAQRGARTSVASSSTPRKRTLDGNILKTRGDNTVQHPAHGPRSFTATAPRLDKPPLDKNILRALGYPYAVRSPRSHTASSSNLSKPPLDKNIAKALGYDPERYGFRGPRRPIAPSASLTKPLLFSKSMEAGRKQTEPRAVSSSEIPIASSPAPGGKLPPGDIEDNSAPQRRNIRKRGGTFSAGKAPEAPDQHTPDESIQCSGAKADSCKKKCACSAEGSVVCGNMFGPGITPWVRGALLTTGENAQKKMTEQEAQLTAECATACQCKVNGVFGFGSRKMKKLKLENAEEKSAGIGRFRVDRSLKKPSLSPDASPKALSILPSQASSLQRRGGSDAEDAAMSSAPSLGQHTLKNPIWCEGGIRSFCEDRCYCTPDGVVKCDSKETVEDLFVHNLLENRRLYQLDLLQSRAKKAQYITEVTGKCTPTCRCSGDHGYKEPRKGLRNALSVIPSQTPSIQPRGGTDLGHTVKPSTPAAGINPRSGIDVAKPETTFPASSGNSLRPPPIVCRGPQQNECEESCYCSLRGIVKCNRVSTADEMHAVLKDPKYPHLHTLPMVQKTNLLTYHVAQRTTECVPSCSCDGGKEFGKHGELGWQFDATQRLARPDMWRSRSGSEGEKKLKNLSSVQERSISIFPRGESKAGSHQSSTETANPVSSSSDHSKTPKSLIPRGRSAPTVRQAYPLPRTGAGMPSALIRPRHIVCRGSSKPICDQHCRCSEDGKVVCNEPATISGMLATLRDPRTSHMSAQEKSDALGQDLFHMERACVVACSCDGGRTFGKGRPGWNRSATPSSRPPADRRRHSDHERGQQVEANRLQGLPPPGQSQHPRLQRQSHPRPHPFSVHRTDLPRPRPSPRTPSPQSSPLQISPLQILPLQRPPPQIAQPQSPNPQSQTLFRPTPRYGRPQIPPPPGPQPLRPIPTRPLPWLLPPGQPLFRPQPPPQQPQQQGQRPPQRPPAPLVQLEPWEQYQQQPQYRHIPQLLRPPQKRSLQPERRSALPPAQQTPTPQSQPQDPYPQHPEWMNLPWFKPSPRESPLQRAPQPQSPGQKLFRPVAVRPKPWHLPHDHPLYRPQPPPPRSQAPQQQEQRPRPPQQPWAPPIPNAVEIYQQLPQHRHITELLRPPHPRPPQQKRSLQPQTPPQPPQPPRPQPQSQPQQAPPPQSEPVEPINPLLPQAHALHQQFLHQNQRQIHLRNQRSHLLASANQHFPPTAPPRSPNHRRQLGHTLICDEAYAERESCEKRCYCTPEAKIVCDTAKTRMEMETIFTDPANRYFNKVTDKHKEKLERMHVRQVERGCAEECTCERDGGGGKDKGKGKGLGAKGGVGKKKGGGKGKENVIGGGLEGGRGVLVARSGA